MVSKRTLLSTICLWRIEGLGNMDAIEYFRSKPRPYAVQVARISGPNGEDVTLCCLLLFHDTEWYVRLVLVVSAIFRPQRTDVCLYISSMSPWLEISRGNGYKSAGLSFLKSYTIAFS